MSACTKPDGAKPAKARDVNDLARAGLIDPAHPVRGTGPAPTRMAIEPGNGEGPGSGYAGEELTRAPELDAIGEALFGDATTVAAPRVEVLDASELLRELPAPNYPIKGFAMSTGSVTVFAAASFGGKTIVMQDAILARAAHQLVWGRYETSLGRSLHIDLEQGYGGTIDRYQRLARARKIDLDVLARESLLGMAFRETKSGSQSDLLLLTQPAERYAPARLRLDIEERLKRLCDGYSLVFIDSLAAACPGLDENAPEMGEPVYMLGRVARSVGAAIVVAHHMNKASMGPNASPDPRALVRGSTAIVAAADYVYAMTGARGEPKAVAQAKGRSLGDPRCDDFAIVLSSVKIDGYANPSNPDDPGGFAVTYQTAEQVAAEKESGDRTRAARAAVLLFAKREADAGRPVSSMNAFDDGIKASKGGGIRRQAVIDAVKALCGLEGSGGAELEPCGGFKKGAPSGPFKITAKGEAWLVAEYSPKRSAEGLVQCPKCGGSGKLPEYRTVNGGQCAPCRGEGRVSPAFAERIAADIDAQSRTGRATE